MSNDTKAQIIAVMEDLLEAQPDMRFGQMVSSLALFAKGPIKSATWDVDDSEFLEAAKRHRDNLNRQREAKEEINQLTAALKRKTAA
jgi:hypothetical protein